MNSARHVRSHTSQRILLGITLLCFAVASAKAQAPSSSSMYASFDGASTALLEDAKTLLAMESVMTGNEQDLAGELEDVSQQLSDLAGTAMTFLNLIDAGGCHVSLNQPRILSHQFGFDVKTASALQKRILLAQSRVRTPALRDAAATLAQHAESTTSLLRAAQSAYAVQ